jgi:hypothetical protein
MPRERKPPTTTIRVHASLADDLDVIAEYLRETTNKQVTVASLLYQWCKPHIDEHRQRAYKHRIEREKRKMQNPPDISMN